MDNIDDYIRASDDALFHYTRVSIAIEHILHTAKLRLSLLNDTNDPNEYKQKLFGSGRRASVQETQLQEEQYYEALLRKAQTRIEKIRRSECRVMCFCTNDKPTLILSDGTTTKDKHVSKGWEKSRMWSQYGQNHHGICLVFSKRELDAALARAKQESQIEFYRMLPVEYSQQQREWPMIDGTRLKREGLEGYSLDYIKNNSKELFFRKHVDYRDEAELRVVVLDADKKFEYVDITSFIKCVIVGDRISKAYFPLIKQMCRGLNTELRRAGWSRSKSCWYLGKCTISN